MIGDLIVDEYITCEALGMSQEEPALVAKTILHENNWIYRRLLLVRYIIILTISINNSQFFSFNDFYFCRLLKKFSNACTIYAIVY